MFGCMCASPLAQTTGNERWRKKNRNFVQLIRAFTSPWKIPKSIWVGNTNYSESCVGIKDENIDVGGNISNGNLNLQNYQ